MNVLTGQLGLAQLGTAWEGGFMQSTSSPAPPFNTATILNLSTVPIIVLPSAMKQGR